MNGMVYPHSVSGHKVPMLTVRVAHSIATCVLLLFVPLKTSAAEPYDTAWIRQFGSVEYEFCFGICADSVGNTFACGQTCGVLGDATTGGADGFLVKHDAAGNLLWTRQIGTEGTDCCAAVSADADGNVFVAGVLYASLGERHLTKADAFLRKYDADGGLLVTATLN